MKTHLTGIWAGGMPDGCSGTWWTHKRLAGTCRRRTHAGGRALFFRLGRLWIIVGGFAFRAWPAGMRRAWDTRFPGRRGRLAGRSIGGTILASRKFHGRLLAAFIGRTVAGPGGLRRRHRFHHGFLCIPGPVAFSEPAFLLRPFGPLGIALPTAITVIIDIDDAEIMLCMLQIILGPDPVAGRRGVAGHGQIFLMHLKGAAANSDAGTVAVDRLVTRWNVVAPS